MDIKIRKVIYKLPVINFLGHEIIKINNYIYYKVFDWLNKNHKKIEALKNSHVGESCYIVGNGPSLICEDLDKIIDKDCLASNLIFKIFPNTKWRPKYYFIQDRYADTGKALDQMQDIPFLFISEYYWRKRGIKNPNAICINTLYSKSQEDIDFSEDISKGVVTHWTITYTMIQMAVYLGYKRIFLLGIDHNYSLVFDCYGNVVKNNRVESHFFQDRNPEEVIANIEAMNKAYISARKYADEHGIEIYNVTRGGKLEWFERKTLEESLLMM